MWLKLMVPRAAAALSYYLTMTMFPMIICLYALFGQNYHTAAGIFNYIEPFLTPSAAGLIQSFLLQVACKNGHAVLVAAITMLVLSASAAIRTLRGTIDEMQGAHRFRVVTDVLLSLVLALGLLFAVYFSIVVLLTSHQLLLKLQGVFSFIHAEDSSWSRARYLLLGSIALLILWGIFALTRARTDRYHTLPGAAFATVGIVAMSSVFSTLIVSSTRYSLVYGSLASIILLMLWLYMICQAIFAGAILNIALRDRKRNAPGK